MIANQRILLLSVFFSQTQILFGNEIGAYNLIRKLLREYSLPALSYMLQEERRRRKQLQFGKLNTMNIVSKACFVLAYNTWTDKRVDLVTAFTLKVA